MQWKLLIIRIRKAIKNIEGERASKLNELIKMLREIIKIWIKILKINIENFNS